MNKNTRVAMPHYSAECGTTEPPENAVKQAFSMASEGRRQASLAASRLESLIYRHPEQAQVLAAAALAYLSGEDLTADAKTLAASGQAVIRRLNEALDGASARVTKTLLSPEQIMNVRRFRAQVRDLMKDDGAPETRANRSPGLPNTLQRKALHDEGTT